MKYLINYLKVLVVPLGVLLLFPLVLAIINLFGIKSYTMLILIPIIITSLITGFIIGRKAEKKGYINGLILGLIISLIFFIFSLFGKSSYDYNTLIYYLIIIASSTVGSMAGIQKKTK